MKKTVFVTGGTIGSGYASARRYAEDGYAVALTSRDRARAEEAAARLAAECGCIAVGYGLEVGDESLVEAVFADLDAREMHVEAVVLNSANMGFGVDPAKGMDFFDSPLSEVRAVFETNLVWNWSIIRAAARRMRDRETGGAIVFIGSNTSYRAIPNRAAYSASKGGINSLSRALAVDLGRFGIRSNVVLPGTIKTERWVKMGDKQIVNGELTPIGDISDFEDIANAAFFLGTPLAKNITGSELTVDGGMTAQLFPECLGAYKRKVKGIE